METDKGKNKELKAEAPLSTAAIGKIAVEKVVIDKVDEEVRCTCNDQFVTTICPACYPEGAITADDRPMIVTDAQLVPEEIRQWQGYAFVCLSCDEPAILDFMKYCGNCGSEVVVQSHKVTAFVRKLQAQKHKKSTTTRF